MAMRNDALLELDDYLRRIVEFVVRNYDADVIYLFGSRASGRNSDSSDYDIAIEMSSSANDIYRRQYREKLTDFPIDFIVLNSDDSKNSALYSKILESGVVLYSKKT